MCLFKLHNGSLGMLIDFSGGLINQLSHCAVMFQLCTFISCLLWTITLSVLVVFNPSFQVTTCIGERILSMGPNDSLTYTRYQLIQIGRKCQSKGFKLPLNKEWIDENKLCKHNTRGSRGGRCVHYPALRKQQKQTWVNPQNLISVPVTKQR